MGGHAPKGWVHIVRNLQNDNPSPVRTYRKYDDEPLNSRITKPAVKGGTLLADFDGNPLVLKLSDNAVDAYNKGLLPLNTLANAALRSWDGRQKTSMSSYYNQQYVENNVDVLQHIKNSLFYGYL